MGKGGQHTTSTVTQQNIPEEFQPYFERMLLRGEAASQEPYTPYGGQRLAGQTGDTLASQQMVRDIATNPQPGLDLATGMTANNARAAQGMAGGPNAQFSEFGGFQAGTATPFAGFQASAANPFAGFQASAANPFAGFQAGTASPFAGFQAGTVDPYAGFQAGTVDPYAGFQASTADPYAEFNEFQFSPSEQFSGEAVGRYMNPFMQNVVDIQKQQAATDFQIAQQSRNAGAIQAGAFGGSRQGVQAAMAERDLLTRTGTIQAEGLSNAYTDAQRMFEADRGANFATQQARAGERSRVQAGQASELGRTQGMNFADLARVQAGQASELGRTQGLNIGELGRVQTSQANELGRVQGLNIGEQGRVQAGQAGELGRTQGLNIGEQGRVQTSQAGELGRTQELNFADLARVQAGQASELGRTQGLNFADQARVQAGQASELGRTQGLNIGEQGRVQTSQASELGRVQGARAEEGIARDQFGLDALTQSSSMANQLARLSEQARTGDIQAAQLLEVMGRSNDARSQAGLDIAHQDFLRQQGYPMEQLQQFSAMINGLPVQPAGSTTTQTPYNPVQQALGMGISALGLYRGLQ